MPLKYFRCPDEQEIEVAGCLEQCRMGRRCLTKPTLVAAAEQRPWTGRPSTTQLLDGTMLAWLKLTVDYGIDPKSRAFALLGTAHHRQLEDVARELGLPSELKLDGEVTGIMDLLETEQGEVVLSDLKTWGSYRVGKALGLEKAGKDSWQVNERLVDLWDTELQLNNYRLMVEKQLGIHVDRMQLQVTVRDGGLRTAKTTGIDGLMYMIPVRMLPDGEVEAYFNRKAAALMLALEQSGWDEWCDDRECWNGARCAGYCEVSSYCPRPTGNKW